MGFFTKSSPKVSSLKKQRDKLQSKYNAEKYKTDIATKRLNRAKGELVGFDQLYGHILQLLGTK